MKAGIHPANYRLVVFEDLNNNTKFLIKSTIASEETTKWEDGQTYPLVKMHITSASHPYYTGIEKVIDIEGRIDKFKARQTHAKISKQKLQAKTSKVINQRKNQKTKSVEENFKLSLKPAKTSKKSASNSVEEKSAKSKDQLTDKKDKQDSVKSDN